MHYFIYVMDSGKGARGGGGAHLIVQVTRKCKSFSWVIEI